MFPQQTISPIKLTIYMFDSAKNVEIRDHFIKSIKFLGINNATSTNVTSN